MTKLPRREQNRLTRERAILDAALKVFAATGALRAMGCRRFFKKTCSAFRGTTITGGTACG